MNIYPLPELIDYVRKHSPFYRDLYAKVKGHELRNLPLVPQVEFWKQNSWRGNRVLTGRPEGGVLFKSGGTTGEPKFSVFTQDEWDSFTEAFGAGMAKGGLSPGERVGNIFYVGDLYASFLFIMKSMENAPVSALHFPISGALSPEAILKVVAEYELTTLAGVPTSLLQLASHLRGNGKTCPSIKKILFGGESMYPDQRAEFASVMPGVRVQSIGYASVDAGLLGYVTPACEPEVHHTFGETTIIEIIDPETQEPIEEVGQPGYAVLTNLTRRLMPILRYPVGDMAEWVDPPGTPDRRLVIKGRSEEGARVGPTTMYFEDVLSVLLEFRDQLGPFQFQLCVHHHGLKDELVIRLAADGRLADSTILGRLAESRPMLAAGVAGGIIHPPRLEWVARTELAVNPRTGKHRRILDLRK